MCRAEVNTMSNGNDIYILLTQLQVVQKLFSKNCPKCLQSYYIDKGKTDMYVY